MPSPTLVRVSSTSNVNAGLLATRLTFANGSDWYALLIQKAAGPRKITAHKSTDSGLTWSEVAVGTGPNTGDNFWENFDAVQVGTKLWISYAAEVAIGNPTLKVVSFDMATDAFGFASSAGPTLYPETGQADDGGDWRSMISYDSATDLLHLVYMSTPEMISGSDYGRVSHITYSISGASWGIPFSALGSGDAQSYFPSGVLSIPGGRTHLFGISFRYSGASYVATNIWTRCRNANGTWNAAVLATDQGQVLQEPVASMPLLHGGKVWLAIKARPPGPPPNFNTSIKTVSATEAAVTSWTLGTVNLNTDNGGAGSVQPPELLELSPTRLMVLWQESADLRRIRYRIWNGTTWGTIRLLIDTSTINPSYSPENFHGRKAGARLQLMAPVLFASTFDSWVLAVDAPSGGNFASVS